MNTSPATLARTSVAGEAAATAAALWMGRRPAAAAAVGQLGAVTAAEQCEAAESGRSVESLTTRLKEQAEGQPWQRCKNGNDTFDITIPHPVLT